MKIRNSLLILCSAAFCFSLALAGCNSKSGPSSSVEPAEEVFWTVNFDSQGGSEVASQTVKNGETLTKPVDPTKDNYVFNKWCEDKAGVTPFDFSRPITSNWTLFASWKTGETPIPPEPTTGDYYAVIGDVKKAMASNTERIAETQTGNYVCTFQNISEGQVISFVDAEDNPIINFGPDLDYESYHNNVKKDGSVYKVHNDATNVQVTFRTWTDEGYSFWIDGYQSGVTPIGDYVYTVNSLPNWITNDGCVIFAWTWSAADAGSWHQTIFTSETELQFAAGEEKNGFLLVRCVGGTTTPDWDATDDNSGRIYNKTGDITCSAGNYIYASPEWEGYTPSGGSGGGEGEGDPSGAHGPQGSSPVNWYIVGHGSFSTNSWSIDGGIRLYSNPNSSSDLGCILNVTFAVDDVFKVTDGSTWYGYEQVDKWNDPANKGLSCFAAADDGYGGTNFKCTVAGSYDIYVNSSATFWIQSAA